MKLIWFWAFLALAMTGCTAAETFETVSDELTLPVMAQPRQILLELPEGAALPVLENQEQQIYMGENYELMVQTLAGGDLSGTIRAVCGYDRENLTLIQTQWQDVSRYDFVWACAGENVDRLGRGTILDDGSYHYCLTVLEDAAGKGDWEPLFGSFSIGP